ncbi:MAG TPA: hypothetical protein VFK22_02870 [Candidatus Dormibacteraeota bacterium]|nr:hypothetical protein [Candidatus Dormibacteraeota bacterium]
MILDWISLLVILAIPAVLAFAGTTLLLRRSALGMLGGAALILVTGFFPLLLAYSFLLGIAAVVVGAVAAIVREWRGMPPAGWALAAAAFAVVVAEPLLVFNISLVQADETYSRCAADMAVTAIQRSVAQGRGYPADMREVAQFDGEYGVGACYVSPGVNWLYRVSIPGTYTLGYWVDWRVTRHVCLFNSRTRAWSCGFETWGPFKPGEVD